MPRIFLGVVADDFTGAADAASFLVASGIPTLLFNGIPKENFCPSEDVSAIVIALKSRTCPVQEAVKESLYAFRWLMRQGTEHLYFKYCSTFDSTNEGNIGPVIDAMLEELQLSYTLLCPALPVNGRTVKDGRLFVHGVPLNETHMRYHPLTPMTDSYIPNLMTGQGKHPSVLFPANRFSEESRVRGNGNLMHVAQKDKKERFYVIPDYYEESHGDDIARIFGNLPFLTGGSGLIGALGRLYAKEIEATADAVGKASNTDAPVALLLAGSCSAITLEQIATYKNEGHPCRKLDPLKLLDGTESEDTLYEWATSFENGLIYSSASNTELRHSPKVGKERVAEVVEKTFAGLASRAIRSGYDAVVVAGGETSGAVVKALAYYSFYVGENVAPGVPVLYPTDAPNIKIILKSGNFGQPDFFSRALKAIGL